MPVITYEFTDTEVTEIVRSMLVANPALARQLTLQEGTGGAIAFGTEVSAVAIAGLVTAHVNNLWPHSVSVTTTVTANGSDVTATSTRTVGLQNEDPSA